MTFVILSLSKDVRLDRTLYELLVNCNTTHKPGRCAAMWFLNLSEQKSNPLVSVIVRTKDRPALLKRALRSIAAQTYRSVEVVLVNDGGCDLDRKELQAILGKISLNYIRLEENTGRAHAGNVGLENAKGEVHRFFG